MSLVRDSSVSVDAYWSSEPEREFVGALRSDQMNPVFDKLKATSEVIVTFKVTFERFDLSDKRIEERKVEKVYLLKLADNKITFHDMTPSSTTADAPFKAGASEVVNTKYQAWQINTQKTAQLLLEEPELGSRFMKLASEEVLK